MLLNTGIGIVAGALMGFSELAGSFEMVIIGRIVVGFNCGKYHTYRLTVCKPGSTFTMISHKIGVVSLHRDIISKWIFLLHKYMFCIVTRDIVSVFSLSRVNHYLTLFDM